MNVLPINPEATPEVLLILPSKIANVSSIPFVVNKYMMPLGTEIASKTHLIGIDLPEKGKVKKAQFDSDWELIRDYADTTGAKIIVTCITEYLTFILKSKKAFALERNLGKCFEQGGYTIIPTLNASVLNFQPQKVKLLQRSIAVVQDVINGTYVDETQAQTDAFDINLCTSFDDSKAALQNIFSSEVVACDIETTGLDWQTEELLTISFSTDDTSGFCIPLHDNYGVPKVKMFRLLKTWLSGFKGTLLFHNGNFDVAFLVRHIFMDSIDDRKGMLDGINTINFDDTMIMAWLCLNSTERPAVGLKELAFNYLGDWDASINQAILLEYPYETVGRYNVLDTIATYHIYERYSKLLVEEEQDSLYKSYYVPLMKTLLKVKMTGLYLNSEQVENAYTELDELIAEDLAELRSYDAVKEAKSFINGALVVKYNKSHVKQKTIDDFDEDFKPSSPAHKQLLLFEVMGFEVTKKSKTSGAPSADKEVMLELLEGLHVDSDEAKILQLLLDISGASIVRNTFLKPMKERSIPVAGEDGLSRLFGDYRINGTASGRLSGYNPNLQQLPSGSKYGKLIKKCITAPEGFVVCTADLSSCEDKVAASLSNCKNKLKEFTEGFDGHSVRCAAFFKEDLEDRGLYIDTDDKDSVNRIKTEAKDLRQMSKAPSFAMQYSGGVNPIMRALKCSEAKAQEVYDAYWALYPELRDFAEETEVFAEANGYVECFFGLKLRAANIKAKDNKARSKEVRTLNNARIQSAAMLTTTALDRTQLWIEANGYENDILLNATIHDSIYACVRNDAEIIEAFNKELIKNMTMHYDGEIVPNEADAEIGNTWADLHGIENNATSDEIQEVLNKL